MDITIEAIIIALDLLYRYGHSAGSIGIPPHFAKDSFIFHSMKLMGKRKFVSSYFGPIFENYRAAMETGALSQIATKYFLVPDNPPRYLGRCTRLAFFSEVPRNPEDALL